MLTHPTGLFRETIFRLLGGSVPSNPYALAIQIVLPIALRALGGLKLCSAPYF